MQAEGGSSHARDNKLHVWSPISALPVVAETASSSAQSAPRLLYSLDVNALNFCRFSLLSLPRDMRQEGLDALIAVPNLVESAFVSNQSITMLLLLVFICI